MWNQGNYNLHEVFFPSRMMKVLISLYKCYIKSWLQNDSTIGSYDPYNYMFLFNKVKSQWWSPFVPQSLYITQVRRLKPHCYSLQRGNRLVNFCDSFLHEADPRPARRSLAAGPPDLLLAFRTTYFITESEAKAQSAAASPGLWRLSPEFEALPTTWRVGVGGWNSST